MSLWPVYCLQPCVYGQQKGNKLVGFVIGEIVVSNHVFGMTNRQQIGHKFIDFFPWPVYCQELPVYHALMAYIIRWDPNQCY